MATVDIKINNKTYSGVSSVNLPLADGSGYAPFNLDSSHIITKCSITYNLTDVTSSNTASSIASGSAYTTTLSTSLSGRMVSGVVVTMGGTTLSGVYDSSTGVISIAEVTDDISITATTAEDLTAPAFELTTPLVLGDTTDSRINDTTNNRIDTGETTNDDEDWTICVDFTSLAGASGNGFATNGNKQFAINYSAPNWSISWHGNVVVSFNDYSNKTLAGKSFKVIVTHIADALSVKFYGTSEGEKILSSIATASYGNFSIGNKSECGTINRFALYKRVLEADEITVWLEE